MSEAGRTCWDKDDYNAAVRVYKRLIERVKR